MLRTINNLIRTLLFQAHIPPSYWVEALNMAAHLLNILPSTAINNKIPFTKLYNQTPTYEHLRIFRCLCYPHVDVAHKLEPRSTPCIFLGYPTNHRGYRCLDLSSNKIIILRHVRFDEYNFPFEIVTSSTKPSYDFLLPPLLSPSHIMPNLTTVTQPTQSTNPTPSPPPTPPAHQTNDSPLPTTSPAAQQQTAPTTLTHHTNSTPPLRVSPMAQQQTTFTSSPVVVPFAAQTSPKPVHNVHPMVTRANSGFSKPIERMSLHVTTTSPLPRSHVHALRDPNWKKAMLDEYNALITNGTWVLVPVHLTLVVKPATIRTVLALVVSRQWPIHQMDVKNSFLHGHLSETVYMHQPPGFVDSARPDYVCHL
ncbi:ribonuclease H-like domain-containing protein [Tanacetum coccineum]